MADPTPWMLFTFIVLLLIITLLLGWRLDIVSRRIDTVHKRITLNNKINGLQGGDWDEGEHEGCGIDSERALKRLTGDVGDVNK